MASLLMRKLTTVVAAAALCVAAIGCAANVQKSSLKKSFHQLRYYGGPKSPMWRG